ncbi:MAG: dihydropteroate synthase [Lachnospiraceae bacterium]|nr:dihydropteroate synthase [Lachnospiraceae bacterium]
MKIGNREFKNGVHTYVMGILNVTPDSFSDGGNYNSVEKAREHARQMILEGADIIDVGGESTRPGYTMIREEEEIARVVPVIEMLANEFDTVISIDTYKSKVAKAALKAGAHLVNDIWGLKYDADMARVISEADASVCIMHNRKEMDYSDFPKDWLNDIGESLQIARNAGIPDEKIMIDPGVGFAKTYEMNLYCIRELKKLHKFGLPILLGTSRKSVIGLTLDLPKNEREEGTIATTVLAVKAGCDFVRVHNVAGNVRAIKMVEAIRDVKEVWT